MFCQDLLKIKIVLQSKILSFFAVCFLEVKRETTEKTEKKSFAFVALYKTAYVSEIVQYKRST